MQRGVAPTSRPLCAAPGAPVPNVLSESCNKAPLASGWPPHLQGFLAASLRAHFLDLLPRYVVRA